MGEKTKIALLGSTGSIGTQTLDLVDRDRQRFDVTVLAAKSNVEKLIEQCLKFRPSLAIIADGEKYGVLKHGLEGTGIETAYGSDAIKEAMHRDDFDTLVSATVGYSGLVPTVEAIKSGKRIALANKETLVVAGELINNLLKESESTIIPIDSEHSAIYQCIQGEDRGSVRRILITASGGPFLNSTYKQLRNVTVAEALHHPKWKMGRKITIDSATLMNKAFEIIEAYWLFGVKADQIEAVIHPQSIIHSMVEFSDGAIKAQLGTPDMHLPIGYALYGGKRQPAADCFLSLKDLGTLTFSEPDTRRFPCLDYAYRALSEGGTTPCAINAANEVAVESFLNGNIKFLDIHEVIENTLNKIENIIDPSLDDYVAVNHEARAKATEEVEILKTK